jgi:hypothetical protein
MNDPIPYCRRSSRNLHVILDDPRHVPTPRSFTVLAAPSHNVNPRERCSRLARRDPFGHADERAP